MNVSLTRSNGGTISELKKDQRFGLNVGVAYVQLATSTHGCRRTTAYDVVYMD